MRIIILLLSVTFCLVNNLTVFGESRGRVSPPKVAPQGKGEIYDKYGHLQQTWRTQQGGSRKVEVYDKHGHLEYSISPDGSVMDKNGHEIGKILRTK